jgi:hypothetical protein
MPLHQSERSLQITERRKPPLNEDQDDIIESISQPHLAWGVID